MILKYDIYTAIPGCYVSLSETKFDSTMDIQFWNNLINQNQSHVIHREQWNIYYSSYGLSFKQNCMDIESDLIYGHCNSYAVEAYLQSYHVSIRTLKVLIFSLQRAVKRH